MRLRWLEQLHVLLEPLQQYGTVFGSFAARPLCTFVSDLDIALWKIDPDNSATDSTTSTATTTSNSTHRHSKTAKKPPPPPSNKKQLVQKWKQALCLAHDDAPTLDDDDDDDSADPLRPPAQRPRRHSIDDAPTVSYVVVPRPPHYPRTHVVRVLSTLCHVLRKKGTARQMHIRSVSLIPSAKVPILKVQCTTGWSIDVAVGGYGTDTRGYAHEQMQRHATFVPVVLVLKMLLHQHQLDEPYRGGIGQLQILHFGRAPYPATCGTISTMRATFALAGLVHFLVSLWLWSGGGAAPAPELSHHAVAATGTILCGRWHLRRFVQCLPTRGMFDVVSIVF
jgi:hypothetical protein